MSLRKKKQLKKKEADEEEIRKTVERYKKEKAEHQQQEEEEEKVLTITLEQPHGEIEQFYLEALYNAHAIKMKKSLDYNSGRVNRTDYYLYGEKSLIDEIWKKMLRLISLYDVRDERNPENESIENNLLDLMNYCADLYAYRRWKDILSYEAMEDEQQ